jgi:hypothetical protein
VAAQACPASPKSTVAAHRETRPDAGDGGQSQTRTAMLGHLADELTGRLDWRPPACVHHVDQCVGDVSMSDIGVLLPGALCGYSSL